MSTVRFGMACDRCDDREDNYQVDRIRTCEDCQQDLCPACAAKTDHVAGREADAGQSASWRETVPLELRCPECGDRKESPDPVALCPDCREEFLEALRAAPPAPAPPGDRNESW